MSTGGRISSEKTFTDSSRSSQIEKGAAFHMLLPLFIRLEGGPHAAPAPWLRGAASSTPGSRHHAWLTWTWLFGSQDQSCPGEPWLHDI